MTITTGPNTGNCEWSITVKASIGGFQSDGQTFAVNSPSFLVRQPSDVTAAWGTGYASYVYWAVAGTCSPAQALVGLPVHETFGTSSNPGVVSGWPNPQQTSAQFFNFSNYVSYDMIGADDSTSLVSKTAP